MISMLSGLGWGLIAYSLGKLIDDTLTDRREKKLLREQGPRLRVIK